MGVNHELLESARKVYPLFRERMDGWNLLEVGVRDLGVQIANGFAWHFHENQI